MLLRLDNYANSSGPINSVVQALYGVEKIRDFIVAYYTVVRDSGGGKKDPADPRTLFIDLGELFHKFHTDLTWRNSLTGPPSVGSWRREKEYFCQEPLKKYRIRASNTGDGYTGTARTCDDEDKSGRNPPDIPYGAPEFLTTLTEIMPEFLDLFEFNIKETVQCDHLDKTVYGVADMPEAMRCKAVSPEQSVQLDSDWSTVGSGNFKN